MKVNRDGHTFHVADSDAPVFFDFWKRHYLHGWEPDQAWVLSQVPAGAVFVDIGAWIGPWTLAAAARGYRVHAYEPDPVAWAQLVRSLKTNAGTFRYAPWDHNAMVGVSTGTGTMHANHNEWGGSESGRWAEGDTVAEFPMVALGSVLDRAAEHGPPFVKMDVEGDELDLFPIVAAARVPCHVSLHAPLAVRAGARWADFRTRLAPAFDCYRRLVVDGKRVMSPDQIPYERFCSVTCLRPR